MDFVFIIVLILILFVVPVMVRRARRAPVFSKFADHEIINPEHRKVAKCKKCRKTFEWRGSAWKESK
jgi:type IV secretory pathway VirB3-like protein